MIVDITNLNEDQAIKKVREIFHPKSRLDKLAEEYQRRILSPGYKVDETLKDFSSELLEEVLFEIKKISTPCEYNAFSKKYFKAIRKITE